MPPKSDSKGIMSPKSESATGSGNIAGRTRGAAGRRMSREGAESTASEHDLIQYDREQAGGSGTGTASSTPPSMSSAPTTHSDITTEQRQQLESFRQSQQQQMEVFYQSLIQQPVKPAKTAKPAPKVELVPAIPVTTASTASDSKSLTVDPSVARLFSGMVSHLGGLPIMGSSSSGAATVTPGGVLVMVMIRMMVMIAMSMMRSMVQSQVLMISSGTIFMSSSAIVSHLMLFGVFVLIINHFKVVPLSFGVVTFGTNMKWIHYQVSLMLCWQVNMKLRSKWSFVVC